MLVRVGSGFHDFRAEGYEGMTAGLRDLGREFNAPLSAWPRPPLGLVVDLARHSDGAGVPDTRKLWLTDAIGLP